MSCSAGGNDRYQPKFERKQRTNSVALSRQANSWNRWVEMSCNPELQCSAGGIRSCIIWSTFFGGHGTKRKRECAEGLQGGGGGVREAGSRRVAGDTTKKKSQIEEPVILIFEARSQHQNKTNTKY
jgi:hypothetical protein